MESLNLSSPYYQSIVVAVVVMVKLFYNGYADKIKIIFLLHTVPQTLSYPL